MPMVYKITRNDLLEYVGIVSQNVEKRINEHRKSLRFKELGIKHYLVLFEGTYEECEHMEEVYIDLYDTYKHGLNMTIDGKGKNKNCKFNTFGMKFSEETKKKMSLQRKGVSKNKGFKHSDAAKKRMSESKKGMICFSKITKDHVIEIRDLYSNRPNLEDKGVGKIQQNGRILTYERAFSKAYNTRYNLTEVGLYNIIMNRSWKNA